MRHWLFRCFPSGMGVCEAVSSEDASESLGRALLAGFCSLGVDLKPRRCSWMRWGVVLTTSRAVPTYREVWCSSSIGCRQDGTSMAASRQRSRVKGKWNLL